MTAYSLESRWLSQTEHPLREVRVSAETLAIHAPDRYSFLFSENFTKDESSRVPSYLLLKSSERTVKSCYVLAISEEGIISVTRAWNGVR